MASTLFRNIKLGSVPRNRLESFKRSFGGGGGGGGGASYDVVLPHRTSPQVDPDAIPKQVWLPSYARTGRPDYGGRPNSAECHSEETVAKIRAACALAKALLTEVGMIIRPGMSTDEIDKFIFNACMDLGVYPSPLNYRGFPKSVCTSVNNCVCHGIPDLRPMKDGDIVSVDVTVFLNGYHGDCAETFCVGDSVDAEGCVLIDVARQSRNAGISVCGPGAKFSDIGIATMQAASDEGGYEVVSAFTGHGISWYFHGPPDIYHVPNNIDGIMKPGMVFTVEPVISEGSGEIVLLNDGWTANSLDNSRAAQFEHTILITESGHEILTEL